MLIQTRWWQIALGLLRMAVLAGGLGHWWVQWYSLSER